MLVGVDASRAISPHPTGTEIYSRQLIEALLDLDPPHRLRLYFRASPPGDTFLNAEIRTIPFPRLWTHVRLSWEMARHPPDLLFVPAHVLPPIHPPLTLVTVHDLGYLRFPRAHPLLQRLYLDLSTRWNVRAATHLLADSQATKADLITHYNVPSGKITVAYPGYDPTLSPVDDPQAVAAARAQYGIPEDYFLHLGSLQPRKNLSRLVTAFAALDAEASLVLAGPRGWLYHELFAQVRRLGVTDRVHFPGYIRQAHKAALFSGATAFTFPSLYEGFGLPVLEAQACGCPVICSRSSSLPEVAGDGALLLDPLATQAWTHALERVLRDAALRADLIERGHANLQRFSWQRCAQDTLHVIENLVASQP